MQIETALNLVQTGRRWIQSNLLNPLSPNIHIQILPTDLYTFPLRISWENLTKDHSMLSLVIIALILITFTLDDLLMLWGEKWCWSLLGPKRLIDHPKCDHVVVVFHEISAFRGLLE